MGYRLFTLFVALCLASALVILFLGAIQLPGGPFTMDWGFD